MKDFRMEVERLYNEYLGQTENRNTSYGELLYIQELNEEDLNEMYEELLKEVKEI